MVGLRAGTELTAAIDAWAEANGIESRSDAIRRLLDLALLTRASLGTVKKQARLGARLE